MSKFVIHGQRRLNGTIRPVGNKNAALPMLAASLLTSEPVVLHQVPDIDDVRVMLEILDDLGIDIHKRGRTLTLCAAPLKKRRLDANLCRLVRSSILFAGPLAARHGYAVLYPPGGDVIGHRRLDTHFHALQALGVKVQGTDHFTLRCKDLRGTHILMDEASVTATENTLMAATLAHGKTTIYNAACEPHVSDLGHLLIKMGARINGLGTNRITVEGVRRLNGARHTISPDFTEMGSFIAAAAATGGDLTLQPVRDRSPLPVLSKVFRTLGVSWELNGHALHLPPGQPLRVASDFNSAIPKIEDGPWPAFPSDLMSVAIVLATRARGSVLFFEKMFESRMYFVDQLISMGAQIVQCDPHRVVVNGPSRLHGTRMSSPDIRAGMALIIAALRAKGESVIENAQVIDRGYERIDEKLRSLGADIVRVDDTA